MDTGLAAPLLHGHGHARLALPGPDGHDHGHLGPGSHAGWNLRVDLSQPGNLGRRGAASSRPFSGVTRPTVSTVRSRVCWGRQAAASKPLATTRRGIVTSGQLRSKSARTAWLTKVSPARAFNWRVRRQCEASRSQMAPAPDAQEIVLLEDDRRVDARSQRRRRRQMLLHHHRRRAKRTHQRGDSARPPLRLGEGEPRQRVDGGGRQRPITRFGDHLDAKTAVRRHLADVEVDRRRRALL